MEVLKDRYTITEMSNRLSITDHALRYYEKEFSLNIPKDERGRRFYTPELANLMYQIKNMRDEGLEIKAIRRILQDDSIINEPPPVVVEDNAETTLTVQPQMPMHSNELKLFFDDFKQTLTKSITAEVSGARDHLSHELYKTKLELGACVENSVRKLEFKMDKHFQQVDEALGTWREKRKKGLFKKIFNK